MTDMTAPAPSRVLDVTSDRAKARIRRATAEARFRAYGLIAIGFAALLLVALLADILSKYPAFMVTRAAVPSCSMPAISTRAASVTRRDRKGDSAALRKSLVAMFPCHDRASRRQLMGLFSSGAANELRDAVMADPDLIASS
jgi:phosphate transport system permease protein